MNNIKDKFDKHFFKLQGKFEKEKEKANLFNEKSILNDNISEAQLRKTNILLEMGELTYDKIRKNQIIDSEFDKFCFDIIEIDKYIYENSMKIKELDEAEKEKVCECGNTVDINAKFCAECGKKIELELTDNKVKICDACKNEVDIDCNYCVCCGNKFININID